MNDKEIKAVSDYIAGLRCSRAPSPRPARRRNLNMR
jgi:hypothetical protein